MNQISKIVTLSAFTALSGATLVPAAAPAQGPPLILLCKSSTNLTGRWVGNDGGTYRVREVGNTVWWVGMSGDDGKSWTHAYRGLRAGGNVSGRWADVNGPMGSGVLNVRQTDGTHLVRTAVSGGFSGSRWHRFGCPK